MSITCNRYRGYVTEISNTPVISLNPINEESKDFWLTKDELDDLEDVKGCQKEISILQYGARLFFG